MIGRSSTPTCVKCGRTVPLGAGFCPNCGTQLGDAAFHATFELPTAETLPTAPGPALGGSNAPVSPSAATAATIGPTGIATSLDNPSPRPPVRAGDGPFQAGQQISPRYTILTLLGTGGMGAVYQAFDHELGVAVAIKVIRPAAQSDATAAKELEQRFKRELVLARQVTHRYVVRIHDLGEIDGIKYLTMPFVEGETLSHVMRRAGKLPLARVIKIAQQVAQGLAAAHEKGVVHRDLKPENIMLEAPSPVASAAQGLSSRDADGGDALIMDFGIARSVEAGGTQTAAGSVIGTLEYMAPEQAQGRKVDQRADQYAFGLIVYDMLVGRQRLTSGDNAMTELLSRLKAVPPAPRAIDPQIPEPLDQLVMKCLQPDPAARFATTQDLVNALDHLTPDGHTRSDIHEVIVQKGGRPAWQLAAAALVIVALAGTAGWVVSNRTSPDAADAAREPVSVLVADFENKTGDAVFDGVIEQAIGLGIEGASFITAYPRREALRAAAVIKPDSRLDADTALLVARREGITLILAGAIEPQGAGYRISTRAVRAGNEPTVLYTLEAGADGKAKVLETVGALAGQVRLALGDTAVPKDGPAANETFTAASLEAARAYAQAQELQFAGKFEDAMKQYEEAIRLDPDMGRAYSGLAAQFLNLGRSADAEKYYLEALARIDRMTDREKFRTRGSYYLFARKPQEAVKEYSALVAAYPGDSAALGNLAFAHSQLRNFKEAMDIGRRAAVLFPMNVIRRNNAALYAMYAGQFETAIAESGEVLELNPSYVRAFLARGLSEMALGRPAEAIKTFEQLRGVSAAGTSFALAGLADVALYEGRTRDAIGLLQEGITADGATRNTTALALKHATMADALLARGDSTGASREAARALAIDQSDSVALTAGLTLARTGQAAAALKLADALGNRLEADPQAYARLIRGEVSFSQRQPRVALEHTREAQKLADSWIGRVLLARIYLELGAFAEASSEIDAAIARAGEATALTLDEWPTFRHFPQVHYYKGLAQEGLKSPGARASFETFLKIKANGDETGGLVADARRRLG